MYLILIKSSANIVLVHLCFLLPPSKRGVSSRKARNPRTYPVVQTRQGQNWKESYVFMGAIQYAIIIFIHTFLFLKFMGYDSKVPILIWLGDYCLVDNSHLPMYSRIICSLRILANGNNVTLIIKLHTRQSKIEYTGWRKIHWTVRSKIIT